jgi:hypothetical protein
MPVATQTQWTLNVSRETDEDLRDFLKQEGKTGPDAISKFVQEAVQERIFNEAARRAKEANSRFSEEEILRAVDESLEWARSQR